MTNCLLHFHFKNVTVPINLYRSTLILISHNVNGTAVNKDRKLKLPIHLIILDLFGAAVAALGLVEWFTDLSFIPDQFKFEYYYIAMILCGLLMMIPMHAHIFRFTMGNSSSIQNK